MGKKANLPIYETIVQQEYRTDMSGDMDLLKQGR